MDHLPIFLDLRGKRTLLVGDGVMAARKADLLLRAGSDLTVVTPTLGSEMLTLKTQYTFNHQSSPLLEANLQGCVLAFGSSEDDELNQQLYVMAQRVGVLVNLSDNTECCEFIMPALVDRSPLIIAISSGGTSPLLVRQLKARFETSIPAAYGTLAEFAGGYREQIKAAIPELTQRRRFWEALVDGPVAEHVLSNQMEEAETRMHELLEKARHSSSETPDGEVYLVGTGPGDPDLLTFKALRLMQKADVVLYDRLIGEGILNLVRRDADRIYVGKRRNDHAVSQSEISNMLVSLAKEGKRVLRLKGGDPFIFGRGGEEIETLSEQGIAFQVVPGVTAAAGCASYAGIPLTHRDHAQSCIFVTGHQKDGQLNLNWQALIQPHQTVVIYMGLMALQSITDGFIEHGAAADTPAAIIENGTKAGQRVVTGSLQTLAGAATEAGIQSPALIIVGSVVSLRKKLSWFAE
jgi:uroporphyrin-III C-methyltransferase/precorrin-2 dehydrogenase/sirohydrochlorin ferrochelatase